MAKKRRVSRRGVARKACRDSCLLLLFAKFYPKLENNKPYAMGMSFALQKKNHFFQGIE